MILDSLRDVLFDGLKDLYNAENQLVKALPKMAKAASHDVLRDAFTEHLEQTRGHVKRLEDACRILSVTPKGKTCRAMKGLIEEGGKVGEQDGSAVAKDAALIVAAQKVEHYEIAAYGSMLTFANQLGEKQVADLLEETLDEEMTADKKLTEIAETGINQAAAIEDEEREESDKEEAAESLVSSQRR